MTRELGGKARQQRSPNLVFVAAAVPKRGTCLLVRLHSLRAVHGKLDAPQLVQGVLRVRFVTDAGDPRRTHLLPHGRAAWRRTIGRSTGGREQSLPCLRTHQFVSALRGGEHAPAAMRTIRRLAAPSRRLRWHNKPITGWADPSLRSPFLGLCVVYKHATSHWPWLRQLMYDTYCWVQLPHAAVRPPPAPSGLLPAHDGARPPRCFRARNVIGDARVTTVVGSHPRRHTIGKDRFGRSTCLPQIVNRRVRVLHCGGRPRNGRHESRTERFHGGCCCRRGCCCC